MANNTGPSRREAMRLKAEAEEARARKTSRVVWISLSAVAVAVVAILALVITQTLGNSAPTAGQQTPPNGTESFGIEVLSQGVQPADDVPHLAVWEDPQCPACASREVAYGPAIKELVDAGLITAEIRTAHFLDANIGNDSSERGAQASAAADAVGKFREYHDTLFANQPAEGDGFTDQQLRVDFPAAAGIEGEDLTKFQELYDGGAFTDFVTSAQDQFSVEGITGTPTYKVGDTMLEFADPETNEPLIQPTAEDLLRAITEANS